MGSELNKFNLHRRDRIKLNGRLGKNKWGVLARIIERETLSSDFGQRVKQVLFTQERWDKVEWETWKR